MKRPLLSTLLALALLSVACSSGDTSAVTTEGPVPATTEGPAPTTTEAPAPTTTQVQVTDEDIFAIVVGVCFNDEGDLSGEISSVPVVDCGSEHDNEAYFAFDLPDGIFPGDEVAGDLASEGCYDAFTPFVGLAWEESILDYSTFYPTLSGWIDGDHEVICYLYDLDLKKLTGTMANSGI